MFFHKLTRFFNETTELNYIYIRGEDRTARGRQGGGEGRASMTKPSHAACLRPVAEPIATLSWVRSPSDHLSTWIKGFRRYGSRLASDCFTVFFSARRCCCSLLANRKIRNPHGYEIVSWLTNSPYSIYNFDIRKKNTKKNRLEETVQCSMRQLSDNGANCRTTYPSIKWMHVRIIIHNIYRIYKNVSPFGNRKIWIWWGEQPVRP